MSRIAIAAGGTAGHVNPALALAGELKDRGHEVIFLGTAKGMESHLVPEQGYEFHGLDVSGFDRSRPWTAVTALWKVSKARKLIKRDFIDAGAGLDAVVGFGAYVEFAAVRAAKSAGIPVVLHEQNSVPGMANKVLSKDADVVALTYPVTKVTFESRMGGKGRVIVTGNPVRAQVLECDRASSREELGIPADARVLLVFGGSLGATHLNKAILDMEERILERPDVIVLHATGARDHDACAGRLATQGDGGGRWRMSAYIDRMGAYLAAADMVVSRSGASSVAEIAARCVPAVLVPFPYATADHQTTNAAYLVEAGGARLVADADIDSPAFGEQVLGMLDDAGLRSSMRASLEGLGQAGAAARLADAVEDVMCASGR